MQDNTTLGRNMTVVSTLTTVVISVFFRSFFASHKEVSVFVMSFFRSLIGLVGLPIMFFYSGKSLKDKDVFNVEQFNVLVTRSVTGVLSNSAMVVAMAELKVSTFSSISMLCPVLMVVFAHFFLKERASKTEFLGVIGSLFCSLLITKPFKQGKRENSFLGIAAVFIYVTLSAAIQVLNRFTKGMFALEVTLFAQVATLLFSSFLLNVLIFQGEKAEFFSLTDMPYVLLVGSLQMVMQMLNTVIARVAKMANTAPLRYLQIIYGLLVGYFFLEEQIETVDLVGSIGIFSFNILIWAVKGSKDQN